MSRRLISALVAAAALAVPATAAASDVVVSEFRFRGPSGGNDEFVELRNVSAADAPIGGWKLVGCSATGPTNPIRATIPAGVTLGAGQAYLLTNAGSSGYSGDVPGDQTYSTGIGDTGGIRLTTAADAIVDAVGATGTPCREGTGLSLPTSNPASQVSWARRNGTQDTDNNAADFTGPQAATPENFSGETGGGGGGGITPIHTIQGPGASSGLSGRIVTIEGVVTGVDDEQGANFERNFPADAGIYVQEEPSDADNDARTSEGIFVGFVRDRTAYAPGTVVRLNGRVVENFGETRIEETINQEPVKLGDAAVPAPVTIDPAAAAGQDPAARAYYESLEGMNVLLASGTAASGGRNKFGETFLLPGVRQDPLDRVFRTDVVPDLLAADADAGAGDPDNPLVDTDSTTALDVDLFDVVRDLEGPVGFSFDNYKIINQQRHAPTVEQGPTQFPYGAIAPREDDQLRFASFNVENYFPVGGDLDRHLVTAEEYAAKRDRIVDAISRLMQRPDVVAVQEVVDLAILQDVASHLGGYTAYLEEGNDSRGIDVGFLVRDTVQASNLRQLGKTAAGPSGASCSDVSGGLFDRPPLAIDIERRGVRFTAISNHFASKSAPDTCRAAQGAYVRDQVKAIEAAGGQALVAGDLNAFEDESALTTLQDGSTTLDNLWDEAPAAERYSFQFQGRLQTLDHVLVTDGLHERVAGFRYAHFDNDYYERPESGGIDGHHVSDHDPPVVTIDLPSAPVGGAAPSIGEPLKRNGKPVPNEKIKPGNTLPGDPGTWTADEGAVTLALQWLSCADETLASCTPIEGATGDRYEVTKDDRGALLRLQVVATSPGGETTAVSAPTEAVHN